LDGKLKIWPKKAKRKKEPAVANRLYFTFSKILKPKKFGLFDYLK